MHVTIAHPQRVELWTPVFAINAERATVTGTFSRYLDGGMVEILTKHGPRVFPAMFVTVDIFRSLEDL